MNKLTQKILRKMHSWLTGSDEVQLAESGLPEAEPCLSRARICNPAIYPAMCLLLFGTLVFSGQAHATAPTVTTGSATGITATGATLNGTVNPQNHSTTVTFNYGTTTAYGTSVAGSPSPIASGSGATAVSSVLTGLVCGTTYHFQVQGVNSSGTSKGSDATFTTLACVPTVTAISPTSGTTAGGTSVTITGTNFTGATAVTIGGAAATGITVVNATTITATTPAGTAGAKNVVVTTPAGTGTGISLYTYATAPTVTAISPTSGPAAGGTSVTITGTNFTGATAVTIGGAAATSVVVVSATSITAVTPAGTAGAQNVAVTTPGGTATGINLYTYIAAPTVTAISPTSGPTTGGTSVTITGTSFTGATAVTIGGAAATSVVVVSATSITAVTPAGTLGAQNVVVTTPGGTGTGTNLYTYVAPPFCSPPSNIPSGVSVTCVCDQFGRANLNPSTIFGGTWATSNGNSDTTGVPPQINSGTGLLRLTENTANNAKAATAPGIFPAAGNYISVEFNHYAYNSTSSGGISGTKTGADGVAVTLSDYSTPAVPGGFGGSLGYAQSTGTTPNSPGFAGGWIGVGLDEYGNYQNTNEGRVLGPNTNIYQSVAMRGPGYGMNGYRWMAGTGSNPGGLGISNYASTTPAPGYMYQVIVDARSSSLGTINVSVNRDSTTENGANYTPLIAPFNAYTEANYALGQGWISQVVPNYWKISFTGSTGGSNNIHEIGNLRICAQTVIPSTGGTASGFSAIDGAYTGSPSTSPPAYPNFQTGDIYMKLAGTPFSLWVAALTTNAISTGYSAASAKYVQVNLVDNSDNACGPDSARTCNSTCTNKAAVEAGASQIATFAKSSSTGVASPSPSFTLNSSYKDLVAVMKECTTSACTAYTSTATACSADSFSVRPVRVASVSSTIASNTGTTPKAGGNFDLTATTTGVTANPSKYTGVLTISSPLVTAASPATVNGILTGTFPAATSGTPSSTATGTAFTYSEVGGFTLPVDSVYDGVVSANDCAKMTSAQCDTLRASTWTGVDSITTKSDCVADSFSNTLNTAGKYGCNFGNPTAAGPFGRFVPDHFDTVVKYDAGSQIFMQCPTGLTCPASGDPYGNGFVYSGQPFSVQVTARNAGGAATVNYSNATTLSRNVTLSAYNAAGGATANPGNGGMPVNAIPAAAFSAGVALSTNTPFYTFNTVPTAPTGIFIRAMDTDNVTSLRGASSVEGGIMVVSGRMYIASELGSELLPLSIPATAQYWNGSGYVTSATDSVSSFLVATSPATSTVNFSNYQNSLTSALVAGSPKTVNLSSGAGIFTLTAGSNKTGSVDMSIPALTGASCLAVPVPLGCYLPSNTARATFGVYTGPSEFIYLRETY
ncbi:MAG: IPT/TIG domain-containing protein [Gallionella sp.]